MRTRARLVDCATYDCGRTFATRSSQAVQYCPDCRRKRALESQHRYDQHERGSRDDLLHDPDLMLENKLDNAEFSILHDAGPEEAAFRRGARLTRYEVDYLLKYESITVNSILVDNQTGQRHQVIRDPKGHLILDPPYCPKDESAELEAGSAIEDQKPEATRDSPELRPEALEKVGERAEIGLTRDEQKARFKRMVAAIIEARARMRDLRE